MRQVSRRAGEGTKKAPQPLLGEKTVPQLAKIISDTMPEDAPEKCVGKDAELVARYMYDAFYSPAAQAKLKPPRIELARLTVRQYQNAVADLVGSFRAPLQWDGKRQGLRGQYYNARGFDDRKWLIERIDPEVKFDFGTTGPGPETDKFDANQFSIRWDGSVLASETGVYDFIIRCDHAVRLWVNDLRKPLIDAWVKSGSDTEFRASIFLIGGRPYPLKLEFSKAKQGVDDSKKGKPVPAVKAFVQLEWKPPHGIPEVIPARQLSPVRNPETFLVTTAFPPDDRSYGWERGSAVSKAWDEATTDAALELIGYLMPRLPELAGINDTAADRVAKLKDFCKRFADRAFRRPISDEVRRALIDRSFEVEKNPELATKRALLLILKSPRFLYREIEGRGDAYDVAARMAFTLWDSIPDQELWNLAERNQLSTPEQVAKQAERMLNDPRALAKMRAFLLAWLKLDHALEISKDIRRFPGFDAPLIAHLRTSLELTFDEVLTSPSADFRQLLLSDQVYVNGRLAEFYGVKLPKDAPFQKVALDPGKRAGVLTHPYVMSVFAYNTETSPIHRGVFLARGVLGLSLRPPMEAFSPLSPDLHPNLTTRERTVLQTSPAACKGCHQIINQLGFTLENFDAVGRYRDQERNKPIDASGSYITRSGTKVTFNGPRELAEYLAQSTEVHTALAEQLFQHAVKQSIRAYGLNRAAELRDSFSRSGFNLRKLMVDIVVASSLPSPRKPNTTASR